MKKNTVGQVILATNKRRCKKQAISDKEDGDVRGDMYIQTNADSGQQSVLWSLKCLKDTSSWRRDASRTTMFMRAYNRMLFRS